MKNIPNISKSEWLIMKIIWAKRTATTNEVVEALGDSTSWKPKTIMTMLKRLTEKGALGYEKNGRIFQYYALVKEDDCINAESESFLERVYGGSFKPMLVNFVDHAQLSTEEIKELKQILDAKLKAKKDDS